MKSGQKRMDLNSRGATLILFKLKNFDKLFKMEKKISDDFQDNDADDSDVGTDGESVRKKLYSLFLQIIK